MHLRFPLPAGYFPKFQLTPSDAQGYYGLATDIVRETRADLSHYVRDGKNYIDSKKWKLAKSKDRLHCYRKRATKGSTDQLGLYGPTGLETTANSMSSAGSAGSFDMSHGSSSTRMRPSLSVASSNCSSSTGRSDDEPSRKSIAPMVIGYGIVDGTVDDIIYGLHESSTEEMKTLSSFLGDESLVDCAVLHTIKLTRASYLGFKWKLSRTVGGNRDRCFLEYVGISVDHNGDRYGYWVMESVPLASCPAFDDNSISRSNLSFCYIFRPGRLPGQVEVFMEGAFDSTADVLTAGGVGDYRNAMDMLFMVETAMEAAEAKKLSAMVTKQSSVKDKPQSSNTCSICRAKAKLLSSHSNCQTCGVVICSKCRVRKSTFSRRGKIKIACCKLCLVMVKDQTPFAGEKFEQQPLRALQKKKGPTPSEAGSIDSLGSDKRLHRTDSAATAGLSFADTDYSSSILSSAASSSMSSLSVSDLEDNFSDRLHLSNGPPGNALVVADRRMMPSVNETNYHQITTFEQQQRMQYEQQQIQQQQFLARQQQRQFGGGMAPPAAGYGGMPPPPAARAGGGDSHRAGLYNQMLELQMAAERAYNLANQNANMMHSNR